jgi:Flp pilus assembly protein TadD
MEADPMTSAAPPLSRELAAAFRDGCAALQGDDIARAARLFETVLAGAPGHIPALNNLARCHFTRRDFAAAEVRYRQAIALAPGDATAHLGLATSMHRAGRLAAAVDAYRTALAAAPDDTTVLHNLAAALRDQGRLDEALVLFRKALALKPDYHACALNYATALFYKEEWGEAWRVFEARLATHKIVAPFSTTSDATGASVAVPHWRSGPQPRSLLVLGEQGLGDNIQFARFLPELVRTGTHVTFVTDRKLFALLGGLKPGIDLVPRHEPLSIKGLTGWVPLMSLPLALGLRPGGLAPRIPYLSADPVRVARWQERLGGAGFRVGIAWQGNPVGDIDHGRSIPLSCFAPLTDIPGVRVISLQKGDGEEQISGVPFADRIEVLGDLDAGPDAFVDTAAAMMGLDLVITCDTAVAHLAGALGRPFWVLLRQAPDWRWLHTGETSPFYPTARLFRQKTADDWSGVFAEVVAALRAVVAEREVARGAVRPPGEITVPIATGELMDKITILEIKAERIADPARVANVRRELAALLDVRHRHGLQGFEIDQEVARLKALNESLWEVEDAIRDCEAAGDFGERFIALARSVYRLNDRRAEHKRAINRMCGSLYVEEKSYRDWAP